MKVLNYGSLNYDYVFKVDHIIMGGETENTFSLETHLGGKGFNQSVALSKAGLDVYHAGALGEEGDMFLEACREYNVNTENIEIKPGKSGHTIIQIDKNAQNSILLFGGANRSQTKEHIDEVIAKFDKGDYIVLQNEVNYLGYIIDRAYEQGLKVVLNPSPFDDALKECDFNKVSLFLLNEVEGEMMMGSKDPAVILDGFKEKYPNAGVVLTLGTDGAYYQDDTGRYFQEAFKVKAVDTTAAGDTFTGYFIASVAEGRDIQSSLRRAAKASSIAVTRDGAAESVPYKEEVE